MLGPRSPNQLNDSSAFREAGSDTSGQGVLFGTREVAVC